jgi:protein tyrosine phosphatase
VTWSLSLKFQIGSSERREVRQLQFTAWPDHGVPEHPAPFLMFLKRVKALNSADAGPIIVHCSAGVGRTGCFIVIDSMIERMRHEKTIDIYGHVTCLRAQRNYMVQVMNVNLNLVFLIHSGVMQPASFPGCACCIPSILSVTLYIYFLLDVINSLYLQLNVFFSD